MTSREKHSFCSVDQPWKLVSAEDEGLLILDMLQSLHLTKECYAFIRPELSRTVDWRGTVQVLIKISWWDSTSGFCSFQRISLRISPWESFECISLSRWESLSPLPKKWWYVGCPISTSSKLPDWRKLLYKVLLFSFLTFTLKSPRMYRDVSG